MKIKVIDLFVKMANGEKLPEKIKYNDNIYYLSENRVALHKYQTKGGNTTRKLSLIIDNEYLDLNDEVEIIEEPKKIEKLLMDMNSKRKGNMTADYDNYMVGEIIKHNFDVIHKKINELIEEINKLKEK